MTSYRWLIAAVCVLLLGMVVGYRMFFISGETAYKKISQQEAKEIMDQGGAIILDVRTYEEYQAGHIPNAVLLPVDKIESEAERVLPDKNQTILVYCRSGNRSATASKQLIAMGYTNVLDFGGINTWPYEIVK